MSADYDRHDRAETCPECTATAGNGTAVRIDVGDTPRPVEGVDRRRFLLSVGRGAAALTAAGGLAGAPLLLRADEKSADKAPAGDKTPAAKSRPAEDLVKELFAGMTDDQKKLALKPFDHAAKAGATLTRHRFYNRNLDKPIRDVYTKPQQDLIEKILRSLGNGENGWKCMSRGGDFDASGSMDNCGADFFGDPLKGEYAFLFTGHHLTVRCDGNFTDGAVWGGPVYYGHTPNGYSEKNVFYFQTKKVLTVFDALSGAQQEKAVVVGSPGELEASVKFRGKGEARPGLGFSELSADQKKLVEESMRVVLSPFRQEDGDEVMEAVKRIGGLDAMNIAFYRDKGAKADDKRWHFWRLEGPGFVWNYRVLPHVHTYVNINAGAAKA